MREPGSKIARAKFFLAIIFVAILAACVRQAPISHSPQPFNPQAAPLTKTPFQPIRWTPTYAPPTETPTPTLAPYNIWLAPSLPPALANGLSLPEDWGFTTNQEVADSQLVIGAENPVSRWIFALVAPFPTVMDSVSGQELHQAWSGKIDSLGGGQPLLMAESTLGAISAYWGQPAAGAVKVLPASELEDAAWAQRPSWGIIPFEELNPRWKVLAIDGISPIHKDFDVSDYELVIPISVLGAEIPPGVHIPSINRDPQKLTTLIMTGVTALVRATAFALEQQSVIYPAQDIGAWLRSADITHISNEVPFAEDCPYPNPVQPDMHFCSRDKYIGLLEEVGTDVVELTGDHFSDWGTGAMTHTLDLYAEEGWLVYGGGADLEAGRKAVIVEHNGNRLALIGCNAKGGGYARASSTTPGAVACNFDWLGAEVARLCADDYLPIVTFQHVEYYTYAAQPDQQRDARAMTAAGAIIVSGSQAHHPQALEFANGGLIHHGLGNLFFDQYSVSTATRQAFIDRHVFYDGRHISTELLTIMFVDYARPRPMTPDERISLLEAVFAASGW